MRWKRASERTTSRSISDQLEGGALTVLLGDSDNAFLTGVDGLRGDGRVFHVDLATVRRGKRGREGEGGDLEDDLHISWVDFYLQKEKIHIFEVHSTHHTDEAEPESGISQYFLPELWRAEKGEGQGEGRAEGGTHMIPIGIDKEGVGDDESDEEPGGDGEEEEQEMEDRPLTDEVPRLETREGERERRREQG
jgi:hypothetical protein